MKSKKWIFQYLLNEVIEIKSPQKGDLIFKAVSEFYLFCFLLQRSNLIDKEYKNILNRICLENFQKKRGVENIEFLKRKIFNTSLGSPEKLIASSMEALFMKSIKTGHDYQCLWKKNIYEFLLVVNKKGISLKNTYNLTHIVFYSSKFGQNNFWENIYPKVKSLFISLLNQCVIECKINLNWDIVRELYLAILYLDKRLCYQLQKQINFENSLIKSSHGWYLSNGLDLEYFSSNYKQLSHYNKYSIFHTTLICELLHYEILRILGELNLA